jgi:hypothetical protein
MFNPVRVNDDWGGGLLGDSRDGGTRPHLGVDFVGEKGEPFYAPFPMHLYDTSYPYQGDAHYKGYKFRTKVGTVDFDGRIWYVVPNSALLGRDIEQGELIGYVQDIDAKYPGITNHVHIHASTSEDISNWPDVLPFNGRYYIDVRDLI